MALVELEPGGSEFRQRAPCQRLWRVPLTPGSSIQRMGLGCSLDETPGLMLCRMQGGGREDEPREMVLRYFANHALPVEIISLECAFHVLPKIEDGSVSFQFSLGTCLLELSADCTGDAQPGWSPEAALWASGA